jgi:hypothetical protein
MGQLLSVSTTSEKHMSDLSLLSKWDLWPWSMESFEMVLRLSLSKSVLGLTEIHGEEEVVGEERMTGSSPDLVVWFLKSSGRVDFKCSAS